MRKLFKVQKWERPEWGQDRLLWTKYFLASKKETVEEVLTARHGKLKSYCQYDRCEVVTTIEECEFEDL